MRAAISGFQLVSNIRPTNFRQRGKQSMLNEASKSDQSAMAVNGKGAMDKVLPGWLQAKVKILAEQGCDKSTYPRSLIAVIEFHVLTG